MPLICLICMPAYLSVWMCACVCARKNTRQVRNKSDVFQYFSSSFTCTETGYATTKYKYKYNRRYLAHTFQVEFRLGRMSLSVKDCTCEMLFVTYSNVRMGQRRS